jgi:hypothetical protein
MASSQMLTGQLEPFVDLPFTAPVFDFALQTQRGHMVGIELQDFTGSFARRAGLLLPQSVLWRCGS